MYQVFAAENDEGATSAAKSHLCCFQSQSQIQFSYSDDIHLQNDVKKSSQILFLATNGKRSQ